MFTYIDDPGYPARDGGVCHEKDPDITFVAKSTDRRPKPSIERSIGEVAAQLERLVDRSHVVEISDHRVEGLYSPTPEGIERAIADTPSDGIWEEKVDWSYANGIRAEDMGVAAAMRAAEALGSVDTPTV